ncbi:histone-lysine N-methyltransferase SETMAR-like [Macrobrachium rosenbergii]|uniref:histone-lysine N-methyltransferase SETMAR-like n=1 Tax=Macrobrachium rosenbergii TaxID=79674 RepID=UPI0034D79914
MSGWPSSMKTAENIDKVQQLVGSDRRLTVQMKVEELNLNREPVRTILAQELGMWKVCTKMVPKLLSDDQKENLYNPETKRQSLQWKTPTSPRPKKSCMSKSKIKIMLIAFYDQKAWSIMSSYLRVKQSTIRSPIASSMTGCGAAGRLCGGTIRGCSTPHTVPAHTTLSVRQFLANKRIAVLDHPPYSLDLSQCDFWLFPRLKTVLKGTHFASVEEIKATVMRELRGLKEEEFAEAFLGWQTRMQKCINSRGGLLGRGQCTISL